MKKTYESFYERIHERIKGHDVLPQISEALQKITTIEEFRDLYAKFMKFVKRTGYIDKRYIKRYIINTDVIHFSPAKKNALLDAIKVHKHFIDNPTEGTASKYSDFTTEEKHIISKAKKERKKSVYPQKFKPEGQVQKEYFLQKAKFVNNTPKKYHSLISETPIRKTYHTSTQEEPKYTRSYIAPPETIGKSNEYMFKPKIGQLRNASDYISSQQSLEIAREKIKRLTGLHVSGMTIGI